MAGRFYLLMGPSAGTGKTTLEREIARLPGMQVAVSHTTRPMREGEVDGVDYHFIDLVQYRELVARGEFVERNEVPKGSGKFYGLTRSEVTEKLDRGDLVTVVDRYGYFDLRDRCDCCVLWTVPPLHHRPFGAYLGGILPNPAFGYRYVDCGELERRMLRQGRSLVVVEERLAGIADELKSVAVADYFIDSGLPLDQMIAQALWLVQQDRIKRAAQATRAPSWDMVPGIRQSGGLV